MDPNAKKTVVTEDDLLKSIKDLETKAKPDAAQAVVEEVKVETLGKSTATSVKEGASDKLKKALDVSDALVEIVGLIGAHNDAALQQMQKSIQAGAERDLGMVRVLVDLKKSIDENTAAIKEFGNEPGASKTAAAVTEVLHKGGDKTQKKPADPRILRKQVADGLEKLAKSNNGGPLFQEYMQAAIKYESTGQISDAHLAAAQEAMGGKKAA